LKGKLDQNFVLNFLILSSRNPDDPFVEIIPETPEIDNNSIEDDLFKDASKPAERKSYVAPVAVTTAPVVPNFFNSSSSVSTENSAFNTTKPSAGGKLSKFGAVKVVKTVNFDEIEAKAKIEREEADLRGLGNKNGTISKSPQATPVSPAESFGFKSPKESESVSATTNKSTKPASEPVAPVISIEQQEAMDRLGMGMRKMSISQSVSSTSSASAASAKVKQQQGISSEQFSSRNSTAEDSFVNDRLREIDTSKGISSDAFFGRSNNNNAKNSSNTSLDDDDFYKSTSYNNTSPTNSYASLTNSAKDLASKIAERASTIDIKGMKKSISSAGSRLSAYLQDIQNK
jgi:hypothetical protein